MTRSCQVGQYENRYPETRRALSFMLLSLRWLFIWWQGVDPPFLHEFLMGTPQEIADGIWQNFQHLSSSYCVFPPSSNVFPSSQSNPPELYTQQLNRNPASTMKLRENTAAPHENVNFPFLISQDSAEYEYHAMLPGKKAARSSSKMSRRLMHTPYHILAERKRREYLNQKLITLSAFLPGLKKRDKASVIGEATKYLKQLEERVNILEEQTKKKTMESWVLVKKPQPCTDEDCSSQTNNHPLPEIDAKFSDRNVLIKIHCEKHKDNIVKAISEIERLHLTMLASSVLPFGSSTMDLTIIAQVNSESSLTAVDLVRYLRAALLNSV